MKSLAAPPPSVGAALAASAQEVGAALAASAKEEDAAVAEPAREEAAPTVAEVVADHHSSGKTARSKNTNDERDDDEKTTQKTAATAATSAADASKTGRNASGGSSVIITTLEQLRGHQSTDAFESWVGCLRGAPEKNFLQRFFPLCYDERDFVSYGEIKKYCLVKGGNIFVFTDNLPQTPPLYAIPLDEVVAIKEDPHQPDKASVTVSPAANTNKQRASMITILLKYKETNRQAYQFTFDCSENAALADRFLDVVTKNAAKYPSSTIEATNVVPTTAGGVGAGAAGTAVGVTASVAKADAVAAKVKQFQPTI